MSLQRKTRKVGDSLVVGIPAQIAELHGINEGALLEFQPLKKGEFKLISLAQTCRIKKIDSDEMETIDAIDGKCMPPEGWELIDD